ncbi:MAG: 4Fe-4S binding protein [Eubacteriales bacterium]
MRQKTRRILLYLSLFLFPVTMNFFSPYVSIDGAFAGVLSGSAIMFGLLFLSGVFLGRAWCGWLCPAGGLAEVCQTVNPKPVNAKRLRIARYVIFALWFGVLMTGFVLAGGVKGVDPLRMTDRYISVDEPVKYIIYYFVLGLFFLLNIAIGRRGACHGVCWMSPFLSAGMAVGRALRLPQMRIKAKPELCIDCKKCNGKCPMSIDVNHAVKTGGVSSYDCILCGECVDVCPKGVLSYRKPR